MITRWKIKNFKSVRDEADLTIGPLTVFTGANSSGKSTFIQSILLMAQTIAHKQTASKSVVLNGTLMSFGEFDDIKSNIGDSQDINIKCTCEPLKDQSEWRIGRTRRFHSSRILLHKISCDISFSSQNDQNKVRPQLLSSNLSCIYSDESEHPSLATRHQPSLPHIDEVNKSKYYEAFISIENPTELSDIDDMNQARYYYRGEAMSCKVTLDKYSEKEVREDHYTAKPTGCVMRHFIPESILCDVDENKENARALATMLNDFGIFSRRFSRSRMYRRSPFSATLIKKVLDEVLEGKMDTKNIFDEKKEIHELIESISNEDRKNIEHILSDMDYGTLYNVVLSNIEKTSKDSDGIRSNVPFIIPTVIDRAITYLDGTFSSSFRYLGPLRDAPRSLYPLSPATEPHDVGLRGEHTASVLELCKEIKIKYIHPSCFENDEISVKYSSGTLEKALSDWLQYLDVAKSVESHNRGKQGHELKVGISSSVKVKKHELTHVGVGVSQVLPILVIGLLASRDTTLVFEQPELHLHPNVQILLGDFFLSLALADKQCIVESHSEHLLDQIRFRIAASSSELDLAGLTKIYFVEKNDDVSNFNEVKIDRYGNIMNWPKGFFDQSHQLASDIMRAVANRRKRDRENRNEKSA